jgi:hypothetical protein
VDGAFGEVGVEPRCHPKVIHNGGTSQEVTFPRPDEGDHIVSVHGGAMPESIRGQLREETIRRRSLKQQMQDIHDSVKHQGGKGVALPEATPVIDEATCHPIHHHSSRRRAEQPTNHGDPLVPEAKLLQDLKKSPVHCVKGLGDVYIQIWIQLNDFLLNEEADDYIS